MIEPSTLPVIFLEPIFSREFSIRKAVLLRAQAGLYYQPSINKFTWDKAWPKDKQVIIINIVSCFPFQMHWSITLITVYNARINQKLDNKIKQTNPRYVHVKSQRMNTSSYEFTYVSTQQLQKWPSQRNRTYFQEEYKSDKFRSPNVTPQYRVGYFLKDIARVKKYSLWLSVECNNK